MTLRSLFYVRCTNCNKYQAPYADTPEDAMEEARMKGWEVDVLVENGSLWDFCPKCSKLLKDEKSLDE